MTLAGSDERSGGEVSSRVSSPKSGRDPRHLAIPPGSRFVLPEIAPKGPLRHRRLRADLSVNPKYLKQEEGAKRGRTCGAAVPNLTPLAPTGNSGLEFRLAS
jgi:hypothetical protein